jgi:hypothetical protein
MAGRISAHQETALFPYLVRSDFHVSTLTSRLSAFVELSVLVESD